MHSPCKIYFLFLLSLPSHFVLASDTDAKYQVLSNENSLHEASKTELIQCTIPSYDKLPTPQSVDGTSDELTIISQKTHLDKDHIATFSGGVTLVSQDKTITADEIEVNRLDSNMKASGDIHFQNNGIDIFASELSADEKNTSTTLKDTSYQISNNAGHGSAKEINVNKKGDVNLIESSFTACYGDTPDWEINASKITLSSDEKQLEAYHARLSVLDVPIMYLPYIRVPVGNERQTGLLYPKIYSSSSSGLQVELPYYLNINENMDATFTPRYMSKRGTQLLTEYRYLANEQYGEVHIEYLNKDDELTANNDARYLARLEHIGTFSDNFRAYIDYTTISDDNYLIDLGSDEYSSSDAYLYQIGELAYFGNNWQATIKLQDFEILGDHTTSYKTLPHIEINSKQPLGLDNATFDFYSEITQFKIPTEDKVEAKRYHVETGFSYPISSPAWFLNSEIKILQTYYEQSNISADSELDKTVSRTLPKMRLHGGMNFDREIKFIGDSYTQTFEPQLQYLYIPEKDQSNIGVYDTATLQDDYNGLFRDKRYSGLDRVAQANQYSWGITSRLLDKKNREKLRFSIGRVAYLHNNANNDDSVLSNEKSALAAEIDLRLNRQWQFSADMQYNTDTSTTTKSQMNAAYNFSNNQSIQLNHRYTRDVSGIRLEQASVLTNFNINSYWQFVGRMTQDIQQSHSIESYAGFQYSSCCWGVRFIYHRNINSYIDDETSSDENREPYESGFKIEFVYNGLSNRKPSNDVSEMFNSSIFGYKHPYFLNN